MTTSEVWRIALAQINPAVGDLTGNALQIRESIARAADTGAAIVAFPELAITGYPPEDLLLKPGFLADARDAVLSLRDATAERLIVVGAPWVLNGVLYNTAVVIAGGVVVAVIPKHHLPTYGVFDEDRYFGRGSYTVRLLWGGLRFGVTICEDLWYPVGPASSLATAGIDLLLNINGSPFQRGKWRQRQSMLETRASDSGCYLAYVNMVGGQDELIFDGNSILLDPEARVLARRRSIVEDLIISDIPVREVLGSWLRDPRRRWLATESNDEQLPVQDLTIDLPQPAIKGPVPPELAGEHKPLQGDAEAYAALVLGVRDYLSKTGFQSAIVGLSGGIDSSLTACVAVDAVGAEQVTGLAMPSRYSSVASVEDARQLAENLGINLHIIPIDATHRAFREALKPLGQPETVDVADENIQARIRGTLLMTYSNRYGPLVLTTGNKSEIAVGYTTLYGDMAGGYAVLKDVPKLDVYRLARYRNGKTPAIPERVFTKAPSAELRPDQRDTDSLPAFEMLDPILERYVERDQSREEIIAAGFQQHDVERVIQMVDSKPRRMRSGIYLTLGCQDGIDNFGLPDDSSS